jgi:hypothetical protein
VEWPGGGGEVAYLEVQVVPLTDDDQVLLGASVSFTDVTRPRRYKEELEHANQGLEDAYAELQSTNEELQTINDELAQRTTELNQLNAFLESIWAGLGGAVRCWTLISECWCGTAAPRTSGASARRRCRASTSSTWTSACRRTRCDRRCGRP